MLFADLPRAVQDDIAGELCDRFPALYRLGADEVRNMLQDAVPDVHLNVTEKPIASIVGRGAVFAIAVTKLRDKLRHGIDLDPILVAGNRFVDGGHRLAAYKAEGRRTIPVVDVSKLLRTDWARYINGKAEIAETALIDRIDRLLESAFAFGRSVFMADEDPEPYPIYKDPSPGELKRVARVPSPGTCRAIAYQGHLYVFDERLIHPDACTALKFHYYSVVRLKLRVDKNGVVTEVAPGDGISSVGDTRFAQYSGVVKRLLPTAQFTSMLV